MKVESLCAFLPSDRFHPTDLRRYFVRKFWKSHSWLILVFNANKIKIVEFIQESMFMRRKPCAEIENKFDVRILKVHSLSIPYDRWAFDCVKTAVKSKNLEIVVIFGTLAFGPFNYRIKSKCKCLYQILINLTLSTSIRQIFSVLKQRLQLISLNDYMIYNETYNASMHQNLESLEINIYWN